MDESESVVETLLIPSLEWIADGKYQERVWVRRKGPEVDSFDDTIEDFSETCDFFNNPKHQEELSPVQFQKLNELSETMDAFLDNLKGKEGDDPTFILAHPDWKTIQKKAQELLDNLKQRNISQG